MTEVRTEPDLAQRARTALAQAEVGSLVGRSARPASRSVTVVRVTDQPDGQPVVELEPGSSMVRLLSWWPVVTVSVPGPAPYRALHLTGTAKEREPLDERLCAYRLTLLSTRLVSTTSVTVPVSEFKAAEPDPLWRHAPQALRHLGEAHAPELLACVRAHGLPESEAVVPRALDRYGLELAALGPRGHPHRPTAVPGRVGALVAGGHRRVAGAAHLPLRDLPAPSPEPDVEPGEVLS
ncbi:MAG: hypothetical protein ABWY19_02455 [Marmoricola sp.]